MPGMPLADLFTLARRLPRQPRALAGTLLLGIAVSALYGLVLASVLPVVAALLGDGLSVPQRIRLHLAQQRLNQTLTPTPIGANSVAGDLDLTHQQMIALIRADQDHVITWPDGRAQPVRLRRPPLYAPTALLLASVLPDATDPSAQFRTLVLLCVVLVMLVAATAAARFAHALCIAALARRVALDLRTRTFAALLHAPFSEARAISPANAVTRVTVDIRVVESAMKLLLARVAVEPLRAAAALAVALAIDTRLIFAMILGCVAAWLVLRNSNKHARRAERRSGAAVGDVAGRVFARLSHLATVKANNAERRETRAFFAESRRLLEADVRRTRVDAALAPLTMLLAALALAGFIVLGGRLVLFAGVSAVGVLTAAVCVLAMLDPIRRLAIVLPRLARANIAASRVNALLALPREAALTARVTTQPPLALREAIRLDHVSFGYDTRRTVLPDLSATIRSGVTTAVIGPAGAGKTTLSRLLLRLYEPQAGVIWWDDHKFADLPVATVRREVAVVGDDPALIPGTLHDCLTYGRPRTARSTIEQALQDAGAQRFLTASPPPLGQHHGQAELAPADPLEQRIAADTLSRGERWRLALARALIGDPAVLILDEPADHDVVRNLLAGPRRGRTTVLLTQHEFLTDCAADVIRLHNQTQMR